MYDPNYSRCSGEDVGGGNRVTEYFVEGFDEI